MTETAQTLTTEQSMRALAQANAVRLARAELKRGIAEGKVSAAEVILDCPSGAHRWTVSDLLTSQRRWGSTRCRKFLERNGISEIKEIGTLTSRQRTMLAKQLTGYTPVGESFAEFAPVEEIAREPELICA